MAHHFTEHLTFDSAGFLSTGLTGCIPQHEGLVLTYGDNPTSDAFRDHMLACEVLCAIAVDAPANVITR